MLLRYDKLSSTYQNSTLTLYSTKKAILLDKEHNILLRMFQPIRPGVKKVPKVFTIGMFCDHIWKVHYVTFTFAISAHNLIIKDDSICPVILQLLYIQDG